MSSPEENTPVQQALHPLQADLAEVEALKATWSNFFTDAKKELAEAISEAITEIEANRVRAQNGADAAANNLAATQAHKTTVEADAAAITVAREAAESAATTSKKLADKSQLVESKLLEYENKLADLEVQAQTQLRVINGLLPGATAAGLARSFNDRREAFIEPEKKWQWIFVGSVVCLILMAAQGLWQLTLTAVPPSWDELARLWVSRLPIAGALIWLALYASREAALAKRLEEDYGYKAAIAASFQGFQERMVEIGNAAQPGSPLTQLCTDTLATIATPPGRIYEKHSLTITPVAEAVKAVLPGNTGK